MQRKCMVAWGEGGNVYGTTGFSYAKKLEEWFYHLNLTLEVVFRGLKTSKYSDCL